MSAGLSVLADAARFPATWFCLETLDQVAEMAVLANLCAEADTATHQLRRALLLVNAKWPSVDIPIAYTLHSHLIG